MPKLWKLCKEFWDFFYCFSVIFIYIYLYLYFNIRWKNNNFLSIICIMLQNYIIMEKDAIFVY